MSRTRTRQLRLPMLSNPQHPLPAAVQRRCRKLLSQLLIGIVTTELQSKEAFDERKNSAESS